MPAVHKFRQGGNYIVLDICSGAVHVVEPIIYYMLDYIPGAEVFFGEHPETISTELSEQLAEKLSDKFPEVSALEVQQCFAELGRLVSDGMLFSNDDFSRFAGQAAGAPVKSMCFHIAHDCNLRCRYCFADTGTFSGQEREIMSPEKARSAIDWFIAHSGDRTELELDFFGGEPTLGWDTVEAAVAYGRAKEKDTGKHFNFTITTNGVALDDRKIDFINKEISNCVLSLDGRREVNDKMRPTANGKGSYDLVVDKFRQLVAGRTNPGRTDYYVRGTFTAYNKDFSKDAVALANAGFRHISMEPVTAGSDKPYAIKEEDLPEIFRQYDKLYDIVYSLNNRDVFEHHTAGADSGLNPGAEFDFFHFNIDLEQGPCAVKLLRGCGAGTEYAAVTPGGDIYPCHQFVGINRWKMGNINDVREKCEPGENISEVNPDSPQTGEEIREYFAGTHVYSKYACRDCWAKFYCCGGCNANSYLSEGDCRKPNPIACALMKKRVECAIALKA
ncbi:thioether cross-link-forming SCIFF peptide maturase [Clostridia bacterium]|nr:thioether cross-link-forming SCIFF peptide maturase [Clostridia bacterium]